MAFTKRVLTRADLIHVTSEKEMEDVRRCGIKSPIAILPIAIDLPALPVSTKADGKRTLLFLGRLHEIKGIDNLLRAWALVQDGNPSWRLIIAGDGYEDYARMLHELADNMALERIEFVGAKYGVEKMQLYADADLFVLPSHSENFGIVVAEALASGCPAIVSTGAPWGKLQQSGCGWWVGNDAESLAASLKIALSMNPQQLEAMGAAGRQWIQRDFSWRAMSERMNSSYRWLFGKSYKPDWIFLE